MKSSKTAGITLIEVMISMVIFSFVLGMTSNFIKKGMEQPFAMFGVEEWINLIEESDRIVLNLQANPGIESIGVDYHLFHAIDKPRNFKSWKLEWQETNLPQVKAATFWATSTANRTYQWKIYRNTHE